MSDLILKPETVVHAEKQKEKQRQLERRGIAREMLPAMIERVSAGPYLELFARRPAPGWDLWGNQAPESIDLERAAHGGPGSDSEAGGSNMLAADFSHPNQESTDAEERDPGGHRGTERRLRSRREGGAPVRGRTSREDEGGRMITAISICVIALCTGIEFVSWLRSGRKQ